MEYFTLGMETIRITQSYTGTTSHKKHWYNSKDFADYPIDMAGCDYGQSAYFATVDMKVTAVKGVGSSMTNTIWLKTLEKVKTPSGEFKVFIALTHWNSGSVTARFKKGDIIKKGQIICYEGTDGATSNHLHVVFGNADKGCGNGLIKNSNGAWVSNGYCLKPEQVCYIDTKFSKILDTKGINFYSKPEISYYTKVDKRYHSIVDALKSINVNSSFSYRKRIANINGIKYYYGTPLQNNKLLNLLKDGKLIKC